MPACDRQAIVFDAESPRRKESFSDVFLKFMASLRLCAIVPMRFMISCNRPASPAGGPWFSERRQTSSGTALRILISVQYFQIGFINQYRGSLLHKVDQDGETMLRVDLCYRSPETRHRTGLYNGGTAGERFWFRSDV